MTSVFKKTLACIIVVALSFVLIPAAQALGDEPTLPPEGDSVTSPFDPEGLIEESDLADRIVPYGMAPSSFQTAMNFALQYKGWPYVWGGRYPSQGGFDCVGLVMHVYNNVFGTGFNLTYTNAERLYNNHCRDVPAATAQPGDLVFWRGTYGNNINRITHTAIYCGNDIVYAAGDPIGYYKIDSCKNIYGGTAEYFFACIPGLEDGHYDLPSDIPEDSTVMFRIYNPNSGEHFYTASAYERTSLVRAGWRYEGVGWYAPNSGIDVYRLYNPNAGDHHYTTSAGERDNLVNAGWRYEGVGWKSGGDVPLYRQYNPNATTGAHNFTRSKAENNMLVSHGWREEGIAWYGVQ